MIVIKALTVLSLITSFAGARIMYASYPYTYT